MSKDTSDTSPRTETFVKEKVMVGEKDSMYYNDLESKDGGQEGGSDVSSTPEESLDPREAIARKYEQRRSGTQDTESTDVDDIKDEDGKDEVTPPPATKEPVLIEVKINGRVRQVDQARIDAAGGVENYQKMVTANEGLQELAAERKRLEAEDARIKAETQRLKELQSRALSQPRDESERDPGLPNSGDQQAKVAEAARKYREALLDGEDKVADAALIELLSLSNTPTTPQIDQDQIVNRAVEGALQTVEQKQKQRDLELAGASFAETYSDIMNDPRLFQMADIESDVVAREHPGWTPEQIFTEAGDRVLKWRNGTATTNQPPTRDREAEKRALRTPRASSGKSQPKPAPKPETNSEYIARMRKARGLEV